MSIATRLGRWGIVVSAILLVVAAGIPVAQSGAGPSRPEGRISAPSVRVRGNQLVGPGGRRVRLLGVDIDGTESACVQGTQVWQAPLGKHEAKDIAKWGANAVRVPLNEDCWLGINGLPASYSGRRYRRGIERLVADLNETGILVILDLQWSAPGSIPSTGLWPMPDLTHAPAFWKSVATTFRSQPGVMFDLFNEPALGLKNPTPSDWTCWRSGCIATAPTCTRGHVRAQCGQTTFSVAGMQQLVDAVRGTGARQPVMVGGLDWAGGPCGIPGEGAAGECMWTQYRPTDPLGQLVASFHTYNTTVCDNPACWNASVAPVAKQVPVVTGELGAKECSSRYVMSYMRWADQHGISYLAWAWNLPSPSTSCAQQGTRLVVRWNGTTNRSNPAPRAVQAHLRAELRQQGASL